MSNLPAQVSSFIGREAELAAVRVLMAGSRLVTLIGAGGAGKTRLGLEVAAGLADGIGDGVWFVDLAPVSDPDLVAAHVTAVGVSRSPLREWHTFATVSTPGRSGYRMLVSRAGDWTSRFIDDPPSHLWVRGVPTRAPIPAIEVMYRRLVYVVTGSGIGPMLGLILNSRLPGRLVWSTRSPRATYGDALVDEVLAARPDAVNLGHHRARQTRPAPDGPRHVP